MNPLKIGLFIIGCLVLGCISGKAQEVLDRRVSVQCRSQTVASVLSDIESRYRIFFTYSKNYIPVEKRVSLDIRQSPLREVLSRMFDSTAVVFLEKRGKVILKIDPVKEEELRQWQLYEEVRQRQEALISARKKEKERLRLNPMAHRTENYLEMPGGHAAREIDWEKYKFPPLLQDTLDRGLEPLPKMGMEKKIAQVSVFPFFGSNGVASNEVINRFSLNIFWGMNGGVDGLEVGLFFNSIKNDVVGVQLAGMGNTVGGDLDGTQVAGLFNVVLGELEGFQGAGLFNIVPRSFSGVQAAGMFNIANSQTSAMQIAGLMNVGMGRTGTQVSGLFNFAEEVEGVQVGGLLNVADKVRGSQIGLINVADSLSGVSIGLLNFIRDGYKRFEFSANETFFGNFSLRIGVRRFYNILHIGSRFDNRSSNGTSTDRQLNLTWGLGYGFGTGITMGARNNMINLEALLIHVNEQEFWTSSLNLWNQYRLGFDFQTGAGTSVFFGPSMNILFSKKIDSDSNTLGSNIMPYSFYDKTKGGTNVKMWMGFSAGVRF
jgi:hypothetical protein